MVVIFILLFPSQPIIDIFFIVIAIKGYTNVFKIDDAWIIKDLFFFNNEKYSKREIKLQVNVT